MFSLLSCGSVESVSNVLFQGGQQSPASPHDSRV